jgi:hypothetical protein
MPFTICLSMTFRFFNRFSDAVWNNGTVNMRIDCKQFLEETDEYDIEVLDGGQLKRVPKAEVTVINPDRISRQKVTLPTTHTNQ